MFFTNYLSQFLYVIRNYFRTSLANKQIGLQGLRQFHRCRDSHSQSLASHGLHLVGELLMNLQVSCQLLCYFFQIVGPIFFWLLPPLKATWVGLGSLFLRATRVLAAYLVVVIVCPSAADGSPQPFRTQILEAFHLPLGSLERQHCLFAETVLSLFPWIGQVATEELFQCPQFSHREGNHIQSSQCFFHLSHFLLLPQALTPLCLIYITRINLQARPFSLAEQLEMPLRVLVGAVIGLHKPDDALVVPGTL